MSSIPLERPLGIAVAVVRYKDTFLMIERQKGAYVGCWSLPGGKIERDEDLKTTAIREMQEEAGLDCRFVRYAGLVSEHLYRDGVLYAHFLLHLCVLEAPTDEVVESEEGPLRWMTLEEIHNDPSVVPSDPLMLDELVFHPTRQYLHCVLREEEGQVTLTKVVLDD